MRAFELRDEDFVDHLAGYSRLTLLDLDAVVAIEEQHFPAPTDHYGKPMPPKTTWTVTLSNGRDFSLTKAAYERILLSWNPK